ncbi:MAG: DUF3090 family protein [Chloroflexi bacterium]|nr:DUF3090 family protein [Chloroflexota bacterium]
MTEARYQFGRVSSIRAIAVGQPGARRFSLQVEASNGSTAVVWIEKEQLFNLAVALKNLIAQVEEARRRGRRRSGRISDAAPGFNGSERLEFQAGRMAVGYDDGLALFILAASDAEEPENALPRLSLAVDQGALDALADEAFSVCAAGRPLCPLCGAPLNANEKHICPKHNGHAVLGETRAT